MTTAEGATRPARMAGRRVEIGALVVAVALLASAAALALIAVRGPEPPRTLSQKVHAVASGLRCPVCQNLSVADSPSRLAQEMRETIARDLEAGRAPEEIKSQFVAAYGDWILLSPPRRGLNLVAWVAPFLLLVAGVGLTAFSVRRWTAVGMPRSSERPALAPDSLISPEDRALLERALSSRAEEPE